MTPTELNRTFKIKVYGYDYWFNTRVNKLVGIEGLVSLVGRHNFETILRKAELSREDRPRFRFRRGITVTLYNK